MQFSQSSVYVGSFLMLFCEVVGARIVYVIKAREYEYSLVDRYGHIYGTNVPFHQCIMTFLVSLYQK